MPKVLKDTQNIYEYLHISFQNIQSIFFNLYFLAEKTRHPTPHP